MADTSVAVTAGSGTDIDTRTEGTNGNHRQVVVLGDPATNAGVAPVDATAGLKVDLGVDNDVTATLSATDNAVLDTIDAVLDTIKVDTEAIETAVEGTLTVDATGQGDVPITLDGEEVTANLGATDNAVLDSIATNTTGLAGTVSGSELQVDVVAALPAGTNAIGKLAANSGVDIGDVDVLSVGGIVTTEPDKVTSASTSSGVSVGSSSTTILASNASRNAAIIVNDSDEVVYLKYGTTATSNSGIRLNASGGTVREEMYTGVITGICASGSKTVTVTEM